MARGHARGHQRHGNIGKDGDGFAATMSQLQQALIARRQARGHQRHGDIGNDGDGSEELMARSDGDDHEVSSFFWLLHRCSKR